MEIFLLVGLVTLAVLLTVWGYFFVSRQKDQQTAVGLLKQDLQSLEQTLQQFAQGLSQRLDSSQERVNASLRSQLETSSKLIADVSDNLRKLSETNSQVISIASELKGLQAVLANPKHRGVFEECITRKQPTVPARVGIGNTGFKPFDTGFTFGRRAPVTTLTSIFGICNTGSVSRAVVFVTLVDAPVAVVVLIVAHFRLDRGCDDVRQGLGELCFVGCRLRRFRSSR